MGALTAKPYAFTLRSWELSNIETFDCLDSWASNIRIDFRGLEIIRVLPRLSFENLLFEPLKGFSWISDRTRFSYDSLKTLRIYRPMLKVGKYSLVTINWIKSLNFLSYFFSKFLFFNIKTINNSILNLDNNRNFINLNYSISEFLDHRALIILKKISQYFPNARCKIFSQQKQKAKHYIFRDFFYLDINKITTEIKNIFLVDINLRLEFPLLNLILKKLFNFYKNEFKVFLLGPKLMLNFFIYHITNNVYDLNKLFCGKTFYSFYLNKKNNSLFLLGESFLLRKDAQQFDFFSFNKNILVSYLPNNISSISFLDFGMYNSLNYSSFEKSKYNIDYILSNKELEKINNLSKEKFIIFQGHHNSMSIKKADLILPANAITENEGTFLDIFGNIRNSKLLFKAPVESRNNWHILFFGFRHFLKSINKSSKIKLNELFWYRTILGEIKMSIDLFSAYYSFNVYNNKIIINNNLKKNVDFGKTKIVYFFFNTLFSFNYQNFKDLNVLVTSSKIMNLTNKFFFNKKNFNG